MKRDSTPLYFYKRSIRVPAFPNRKKSKHDFHFYKKKKKKKNKESKNNTLQHLFCNEFLKASHISRNQSDATKFFPLKLHFSTKPPSLWTCLLYLDLFCSFVSRVCPKVTISPLDAILAYERFQRNAVLWIVGGGNYICMYIINYQLLLHDRHWSWYLEQSKIRSLLHGSCLLLQGG